jgi:hypothetical protein
MFVGRSEEEAALAGEEMGFSLTDVIKKIVSDPRAAGIAAGAIFGPAAAVAATTLAQGSKKAAPAKAHPHEAPEAEEGGKDKKPQASTEAAGWTTGHRPPRAHVMGADSFSDDHIATLIAKEPNPDKRQRMIYNHERAKRMRTGMGAAMGVVEESVGELFARTPVDAKGKPFLDRRQVHQLVGVVARKVGDPKKARGLVAAYVRMNNIATPGLRLVKKH